MRMFLEPIRDWLMRTLETAGVDEVAVGKTRGLVSIHPSLSNSMQLKLAQIGKSGKALSKVWTSNQAAFNVNRKSCKYTKLTSYIDQCTGNFAVPIGSCIKLGGADSLLVLVVMVWEGGGICTVNLWPVRDTGVPTLLVTDWTEGVPTENEFNIEGWRSKNKTWHTF